MRSVMGGLCSKGTTNGSVEDGLSGLNISQVRIIWPEITTIFVDPQNFSLRTPWIEQSTDFRPIFVWDHRHICRITAAAFRRKRMELLRQQRHPPRFGGRATSVKQLRRNLASRRKWSLRSSPNRLEISSVRVRPM